MSHGKIFQISEKRVKQEEYVKPEDFYDNHDSYADYIGEAVEDSERKECLKHLAEDLKDIFELDGETLVYKGKPALAAFKRQWVDAIHKAAQEVTVDNVLGYSKRATLHDAANGTHEFNADRFCIKDWSGVSAETMAELIAYISDHLWKGQRLYIGAIIDFHY